ncbi:hypothetical protein [Salinibacterium sp.]|uniref:hypothetical protein n=1 Tax=Salinibacterium sp. TaxID=1915057 RepID=UPI00286D5BBF|nr:hypothetical protein [Salinibacterium sp.]
MTNVPETTPDADTDAIRQLALVDRIIGLQAEVANLRSMNLSREVRTQVDAVKSSTTWRIGRFVLAPVMFARRVISRLGVKGASGK